MTYMQFAAACAAGLVWYLLGWPHADAAVLGFLAGNVLYNLSAARRF